MMNRDQLRAARILLHLDQRELAVLAKVNVTTVRRLEGGEDVGETQQVLIRQAVEEAGAILIEAGGGVDGAAIQGGVALKRMEDCSEATRDRIARDEFGRRKVGAREDGRAARSRERLASKQAPVIKGPPARRRAAASERPPAEEAPDHPADEV